MYLIKGDLLLRHSSLLHFRSSVTHVWLICATTPRRPPPPGRRSNESTLVLPPDRTRKLNQTHTTLFQHQTTRSIGMRSLRESKHMRRAPQSPSFLCGQMGLPAEQGRIPTSELRGQRSEVTEADTTGPDRPEYQRERQKPTCGPSCPWLSTRLSIQSAKPQETKQRTSAGKGWEAEFHQVRRNRPHRTAGTVCRNTPEARG